MWQLVGWRFPQCVASVPGESTVGCFVHHNAAPQSVLRDPGWCPGSAVPWTHGTTVFLSGFDKAAQASTAACLVWPSSR